MSGGQIPILIARNHAGAHIGVVLANRSEAAVRLILEGKLSKDDTLLSMDGGRALIAFAEAAGIECELIVIRKSEHLHGQVQHIQNINAYDRRFKQRLDRRRWLESGAAQYPRHTVLAAALG